MQNLNTDKNERTNGLKKFEFVIGKFLIIFVFNAARLS